MIFVFVFCLKWNEVTVFLFLHNMIFLELIIIIFFFVERASHQLSEFHYNSLYQSLLIFYDHSLANLLIAPKIKWAHISSDFLRQELLPINFKNADEEKKSWEKYWSRACQSQGLTISEKIFRNVASCREEYK